MAADGAAHGLANNQSDAGWPGSIRQAHISNRAAPGSPGPTTGGLSEISRGPKPVCGGKHADSGGQTLAALGATGREDAATGACAHAQAEAVRLRPTAGVGLEGALHGQAPGRVRTGKSNPARGWHPRQDGPAYGTGRSTVKPAPRTALVLTQAFWLSSPDLFHICG